MSGTDPFKTAQTGRVKRSRRLRAALRKTEEGLTPIKPFNKVRHDQLLLYFIDIFTFRLEEWRRCYSREISISRDAMTHHLVYSGSQFTFPSLKLKTNFSFFCAKVLVQATGRSESFVCAANKLNLCNLLFGLIKL